LERQGETLIYRLIAEYEKWEWHTVSREKTIARFSTRGAAEEYIKAARLKNGPPRFGDSPFRCASLLKGADDAWVEAEEEEPEVPMDPVFKS